MAAIPIAALGVGLALWVDRIIAIIVVSVLGVVFVVVTTSLTAIYRTALYQYATSREIPAGFAASGLESAFA